MGNWFKSFFQKSSVKECGLTVSGITIVIFLLRYLGLLQFPELAAYDLLFWLRSTEPIDERIVIVAIDETQLQMSEETIISDKTLASLIQLIASQQPRFIGLDLYRDVVVNSPLLSSLENESAYNQLQEVFRSTSNLVGIEKVIEPTVNPSQALKAQGRSTAADLKNDEDGRIRRAYIHPLEDEAGNPAEIPSLGVVLAYQYLASEGFLAAKIRNNALEIANPNTGVKIILEPLRKFSGSYLRNEEGTLFLINWRKSPFTQVSATQVLTGSTPTDIFKDKIVLIGNTTASGSDLHYLPINRWKSPEPQWTYGVEIHGHIASSMISAALDGRPLIKTIPEWSEIGSIILTVGLITLLAEKYRTILPWRLFLITTVGTALILLSIVGLSFVAFSFGYWIPIVPSVIGGFLSPLIICTVIYIRKIEENNENFKRLLKDVNHSLKNPIRSLSEKAEIAQYIALVLEKNDAAQVKALERQFNKSAAAHLKSNIDGLIAVIKRIDYLRDNAQKYFATAYLGPEIFSKSSTPLNDLAKKTFRQTVAIKQIEYDLEVNTQEIYDPTIKLVDLDSGAIERVLENLIDNAFFALKAQTKKAPQHNCLLTIQTQQNPNQIAITIQDNGTGIDKSLVEEIFRPFKSFKAKAKGQGLGLSIAKETLRFHDGDITVETQKGKGSKFTLVIPN